MNQAGFVAIALAGLWIAYLVPQRLRYHQQLLESRADDRFSERLRVLRVAQTAPTGRRQVRAVPTPSGRIRIHPAGQAAGRAEQGGRTVDRPHATRDRISADAARRSAAEHAQRAAHLARRTAGARRRAALTAVLLLTVAAGWTVVGLSGASILLGATPTVLLVGVLGLGRRAVVAGVRADAAWEAGAADRLPAPVRATGTPSVVGRAVHPSEATTEVFARIPSATEHARPSKAGSTPDRVGARDRAAAELAARTESSRESAPAARVSVSERADEVSTDRTADAEEGSTWAPVPVPRPAYTLKPAARRAEPAPLVLDDAGRSDALAAGQDAEARTAATDPAAVGGGTPSEGTATPAGSDAAPTTGGLSLDAILARRRASGE